MQFPLWLLILISHFLFAELFNFLSKMRKIKSWCSGAVFSKRRVFPTLGKSPAFHRSSEGEWKSPPWIEFSSYKRSCGKSPEENFKQWSRNCDTYSDQKVKTFFFFPRLENWKIALFNSNVLTPLGMPTKINLQSHWGRLSFEMTVTVSLN